MKQKFTLRTEMMEHLREWSKSDGESINTLINNLIRDNMERRTSAPRLPNEKGE